jgi:hypothetical protein
MFFWKESAGIEASACDQHMNRIPADTSSILELDRVADFLFMKGTGSGCGLYRCKFIILDTVSEATEIHR